MADDTPALLDALDRVREVRGSLPIFDALVAGDAARVRDALAAAPRHPLRERVEAWLRERGVEPAPLEGADAALARHGIGDLDAWVDARTRREVELTRLLDDALAARALALRSANAYALMAALLAMLALAGWAAALGGLFSPEKPVEVTPTAPGTAPP